MNTILKSRAIMPLLVSIYIAISFLGMVAAPQGPVKRSSTEKVRVVNASPELVIFALLPTELSFTNRYNTLYGDIVEYFVYELLPGQLIDIPNFERNITSYDRTLWFTSDEKRNTLEQSIRDQKRDKRAVAMIPVGSDKIVYIGYSKNNFVQIKDTTKGIQQSVEYLKVANAVAKKICGSKVPQVVVK